MNSIQELPRISVITPNFNYGATLESTIRSVLCQDYPNLEYIVIDGGSTDDSVGVIRKYEDRLAYWVSECDDGQYSAINKGFSQSTGDVLCWLNSDDVMMPWALQTVANIFTDFPEIDWLMGRPAVLQNEAIMKVGSFQPWPARLISLGFFAGGDFGILQQESMFWRRCLWEKSGSLREDLNLASDFELWTRFAKHSELVASSAILGSFTITPHNRSREMAGQYASECRQVISQLPVRDSKERAKLARSINLYHLAKNYTGLRGLTRRISGIASLSAPVLNWNDRLAQHDLTIEKYFS